MAYLREDFTSREQRDLMSVSSDVLFADPLGVREGPGDRKPSHMDYGGITQPGPLHASRGGLDSEFVYSDRYGYNGGGLKGGGAGYRRHLDEEEYTPKEYRASQYAVPRDEVLEPEDYGVQLQETLGHFGSYLWSFVAGGRQCCSMRDRNRKEDVEALACQGDVLGESGLSKNSRGFVLALHAFSFSPRGVVQVLTCVLVTLVCVCADHRIVDAR
ncbi:mas [Symbiodinium necroappetens]|uniref:Mas protein n=1 Tax=Symbiodinium necroappetens TaxID=1628268 RepID=A0A813C4G1_9DINO|nr:mas [Symbiodinium necroappetens]